MHKFEAHITCHVNQADEVKIIGVEFGWKFSCIEGDALMGPKPYCYLTGYSTDKHELYFNVQRLTVTLQRRGVEVLRSKIEQIIFDTKTGIDELAIGEQ